MLEKLLGETHEDYLHEVETNVVTHEYKVKMLQGKIKRLEYQNILNIEKLEECTNKEEIKRQEKDTELAMCRDIIDYLKEDINKKDMLHEERETERKKERQNGKTKQRKKE